MYESHAHESVAQHKNKGEKMKVLFATTNPAKVKKYADELKKRNIELIMIEVVILDLFLILLRKHMRLLLLMIEN